VPENHPLLAVEQMEFINKDGIKTFCLPRRFPTEAIEIVKEIRNH